MIAACKAASVGQVAILRYFKSRKISLADGDYDQRTPLHIAVSSGQLNAVKYLLESDEVLKKINAADRWGATPLNDVR